MQVDQSVLDVAALQRLSELPEALDHDPPGCGECTWDNRHLPVEHDHDLSGP
ncbi:MAG TPA: hypothetical protein VFA45_21040 [Actinomycetes bacterium]|jgi:hypothetical protein|nr:hypothetical protein [Actinomycetes bacterium]